MAESTSESDERFEIYEAVSDVYCIINSDKEGTATEITQKSAKSKYKQSYREAWESLKDFKGWLASVPGKPCKAYCKLCEKELHCHRLSLLKHKVTFKHQNKEIEMAANSKGSSKIHVPEMIFVGKKKKMDRVTDSEEEQEEVKMEETVMVTEENLQMANSKSPDVIHTAMTAGGPLSTHVLDLTKGLPGADVQVLLYKLVCGRWTLVHEGITDVNGRYDVFYQTQAELTADRYKLHFDVDKYFASHSQDTIFPFVEIVFDVKDPRLHYHIPLLLSPYGYSTYRGS